MYVPIDSENSIAYLGFEFVLQNAKASYDFSSNDPYPYPRYTDDWFNR